MQQPILMKYCYQCRRDTPVRMMIEGEHGFVCRVCNPIEIKFDGDSSPEAIMKKLCRLESILLQIGAFLPTGEE